MTQASNVARLFAEGTPASADNANLPCPFSKEQIAGMTKDLQCALEELPAGSTEADAQAKILYVVAVWTCRAARLYAWRQDSELREDVAKLHKPLVQRIEALTTECMLLEGRLHMLERGGVPGPSH